MSPLVSDSNTENFRGPRASGDEPYETETGARYRVWSPRERG